MRRGGFAYCNDCSTFPQEGIVPKCRVLQTTANELCWKHQNYIKTHFHDQKPVHIAVLSNLSFARNTFLTANE